MAALGVYRSRPAPQGGANQREAEQHGHPGSGFRNRRRRRRRIQRRSSVVQAGELRRPDGDAVVLERDAAGEKLDAGEVVARPETEVGAPIGYRGALIPVGTGKLRAVDRGDLPAGVIEEYDGVVFIHRADVHTQAVDRMSLFVGGEVEYGFPTSSDRLVLTCVAGGNGGDLV